MVPDNSDRPIASFVDHLAQSDPSRILYSFAKTKNPADGFQDVCAAEFARAVDRCAWFIHRTLGPGKHFPTLLYIGPQDLNYPILTLACIKTGYRLFLPSPRNTLEAHLSLLGQVKCSVMLSPPNFPLPAVDKILAAKSVRHLEVADFRHWLRDDADDDDTDRKHYPYTKTFSEAKSDPFIVVHTSGSTGLPKPIVQTHGTIAAISKVAYATQQEITVPSVARGKRVYVVFPFFHIAGLSNILPCSLHGGYTAVVAAFPPSVEVVNSVHLHGNVQATLLAPATLQELVKEPEYLDNLSRMERVVYGGGPLPKAVGELILTKTQVLNCLGSTECGILPSQMCDDPRDWQYLRLHPQLGCEYRHVADDLYEQVIVRDKGCTQDLGVFATFPDLVEWPMKDLYSKHPDPAKGNLWLYRGRTDDIIVFSTGEKINPNSMEEIIAGNSAVKAALVTGQGRFQSSLLVEAVNPPANAEDEQRLLEAIWPSVEAANMECPSHGRIHRNMITFTSVDRPMLKAVKGTVQRRQTANLYAAQLDSLYDAERGPAKQTNGEGVNGFSSIEAAVRSIVASSTEINTRGISPESDLFELGLDSLQVTIIVGKLNAFLCSRGKLASAAPKTVYGNPTIAALTSAVSIMINGREPDNTGGSALEKLEELYRLHTANLPISGRAASPRSSTAHGVVVLMTGSTGSVGSYILDSLQRDGRVSRIYCLCRGPGSRQRQGDVQASRALLPLSDDKVRCLDADLFKSYFGLPMSTYKTLLNEVTHIIHNAWRVDFNLAIQSFAKHVGFVRRLVDFSAQSRFGAALFFVSSISAVSALHGDEIAESVPKDWSAAVPIGYGQSKLLSERLLDAAAREAAIPATVCRVGQVAGPTTTVGAWPRQEWLPSLITSSAFLGKIPDSLGGRMSVVDWVPVDKLAESIVELAIRDDREPAVTDGGTTVYNAVNPQHTTWDALLPTVTRRLHLARGKAIEVVPLAAWVDALRESAAKAAEGGEEDVAANPAIKLLDFFDGLLMGERAILSTKHTLAASPTLASVGPIHDAWMENWMGQWGF